MTDLQRMFYKRGYNLELDNNAAELCDEISKLLKRKKSKKKNETKRRAS